MKVLLCLHDFLPEHVGGTEVHVQGVARELARRGHDVTCLFTERRDDRPEGELVTAERDGFATIEVCHRREYAGLAQTWIEPRSRVVFEQVIERLRPDVCHFHHTATWGAGCLASARRAGARVFFTAHDYHLLCDGGRLVRADGSLCRDSSGRLTGQSPEQTSGRGSGGGALDAGEALGPAECGDCLARHPGAAARAGAGGPDRPGAAALRRLYAREMLASADRVLTPSAFAAGLLVGAGLVETERVEVLANGLSAPVGPREPRGSDPTEPLRVGFVGGLFADKGAHVLIEALGLLEGAALELHLHGPLEWFPDYVAELRRGVADLGRTAEGRVAGRVHFHGRFAPEESERVFGGLDLLAVPSLWYENAPLVVDEAFARRVPVVASALGGLAERVEHGAGGRLVPPGDAPAWAQVLGELAGDREALLALARGTPAVPSLGEHVDRLEALYAGAGGAEGHKGHEGNGGSEPPAR